VMIYSLSVIQEADYDGLSRKTPKGMGIDNSLDENNKGTLNGRKKKKWLNYQKKKLSNGPNIVSLVKALDVGMKSKTKLYVLWLMLEFGTHEQKLRVMREVERERE
jgi:hypothetical protein